MPEAIATNGNGARAALARRAEDVYRGLWVSLFYSGRVSGKAVMICSSRAGEGSSTIAAGLSLAGAVPAGAARVALVEMNLRRPSLAKTLGLSAGPGISEIVLDGLAPEDAAQRVSSGLDVYTAGSDIAGNRFFEILRGERLRRLLETLSGGYDHVIVDAAPANDYPDAQMLAGIVKNVVLVARTEQTPREAVAQAKKRVEAGGGVVAGLVLNLRTYPIPKFLYNRV
jgi:Mrp family chromosome partitioning ATPase